MYHIYVSVYFLEWTSGTEPHMRDAYYTAHSCKKKLSALKYNDNCKNGCRWNMTLHVVPKHVVANYANLNWD